MIFVALDDHFNLFCLDTDLDHLVNLCADCSFLFDGQMHIFESVDQDKIDKILLERNS